ncbi:MAG: GAF domain-containing sensor histidine kinase [Anaerolineales bacterium]|nr:GAF domain-containing sensor histidine kinase [Anaerolineales bacterium]
MPHDNALAEVDTQNSINQSTGLSLHHAALSLFSDLSLEGVLKRIVQSSRDLVNARNAALFLYDEINNKETYLSAGISREQVESILVPSDGKSLTDVMSDTSVGLRLVNVPAQVSGDLKSFLGVPIRAYGKTLGQIFLADKANGTEHFSDEDQSLIEMFSSHAAAAIENARLYKQVLMNEAELTQRNEELELIHSLTSAVSSSMELEDLLAEMFERVLTLFSAGSAEIFLVDETSGVFQMSYRTGDSQVIWDKSRFRSGEGFLGKIAGRTELGWTHDLNSLEGLSEGVFGNGFGTIVGLPLIARGGVVGVASLGFRGQRKFGDRELGLLKAVGAGVGVAVMVTRLNRQARRLAILEERERIAMDLHDGSIQSIYAVGLTLDYSRMMIDESPAEAKGSVAQAIEGLDAVIRDIRAYILDLQPSRIRMSDLREGLSLLIREFKANSLVDAELQVEAEAIQDLDQEIATALFLIAQEALSNVGKHARARKVWVSVRSLDERISLQVIDNGVGFDHEKDTGNLGHGLNNMAERARHVGGEFEVLSSPGEGTTITILTDKKNLRQEPSIAS